MVRSIVVAAAVAWLAIGCDASADNRTSGSDGGTTSASCPLDAGVRTLDDLGPSTAVQPIVAGTDVIVGTTTALLAVPLAGGEPRVLASAMSPSMPVVFGEIWDRTHGVARRFTAAVRVVTVDAVVTIKLARSRMSMVGLNSIRARYV